MVFSNCNNIATNHIINYNAIKYYHVKWYKKNCTNNYFSTIGSMTSDIWKTTTHNGKQTANLSVARCSQWQETVGKSLETRSEYATVCQLHWLTQKS